MQLTINEHVLTKFEWNHRGGKIRCSHRADVAGLELMVNHSEVHVNLTIESPSRKQGLCSCAHLNITREPWITVTVQYWNLRLSEKLNLSFLCVKETQKFWIWMNERILWAGKFPGVSDDSGQRQESRLADGLVVESLFVRHSLCQCSGTSYSVHTALLNLKPNPWLGRIISVSRRFGKLL